MFKLSTVNKLVVFEKKKRNIQSKLGQIIKEKERSLMRENLGEPTLDWMIQKTSVFVNNTDFTKMFLHETLHNIHFY